MKFTKLIKSKNISKSERHNKMMDKIFDNYENNINEKIKFLKQKGLSDSELDTLRKNTGLGKDALHDKMVELGVLEEFNKKSSKKVLSDLINNEDLKRGNWYKIENYRFLLKYEGKNANNELVFMDGNNEFYFLPIDTKVYVKSTKSASKKLKSGESYGWFVAPWEAQDKLDLWIETVGVEQALNDLRYAMGNDELSSNLAYIFRMHDFREGQSKRDGDDE